MAAAESCLGGGIGATLELGSRGEDVIRMLFGESPASGFVVSGSEEALRTLGERVALELLGRRRRLARHDVRRRADRGRARRAAHGALAPLFP